MRIYIYILYNMINSGTIKLIIKDLLKIVKK